MAFNISPRVNVYERDMTLHVEEIGDTKGAQVGAMRWGPVDAPTDVIGQKGLEGRFFKPDLNSSLPYLISLDYMRYSNKLLVIRVVGPKARNASVNPVEEPIEESGPMD